MSRDSLHKAGCVNLALVKESTLSHQILEIDPSLKPVESEQFHSISSPKQITSN